MAMRAPTSQLLQTLGQSILWPVLLKVRSCFGNYAARASLVRRGKKFRVPARNNSRRPDPRGREIPRVAAAALAASPQNEAAKRDRLRVRVRGMLVRFPRRRGHGRDAVRVFCGDDVHADCSLCPHVVLFDTVSGQGALRAGHASVFRDEEGILGDGLQACALLPRHEIERGQWSWTARTRAWLN